jgi:S-adenosylmethionine-diacylglycerol 3-amino-3-carboxypropyl transferase
MSEIAAKAAFDHIRYAQLWEDADVLVSAIGPRPGGRLVSICSAGDNALAMLLCDPAEVIAADLSPAQLACLKLRLAAFPVLTHTELTELLGAAPSQRRGGLLDRVLTECDAETAAFWAALRPEVIAHGAGGVGKFERYFRLFHRRLLPFVHSRRTVTAVFEPRSQEERGRFLQDRWNNWRWRWLLKAFFSRRAMGALGRDPAFFDQVEGSVSDHVARRIEHAFVANDPVANPYLRYVLTGTHGPVLPLAWRPEHHATIAERVGRIRLHLGPLEQAATEGVDGWNLSDIFEYMSPEGFRAAYGSILAASNPGARLVYWNMMAPRAMPPEYAPRARPRPDIAAPLAARDQAFFYSAFHVDEVLP